MAFCIRVILFFLIINNLFNVEVQAVNNTYDYWVNIVLLIAYATIIIVTWYVVAKINLDFLINKKESK